MDYKELTIVRTFDAPRERVWNAWTDPADIARWWGPRFVTCPESEIDLRVGGTLRLVMLAGDELGSLAGQRWPMQGTFLEISMPEKLHFTNDAVDENDNVLLEGTTTVLFEEEADDRTKMTLMISAKGVTPQAPQMLAGMEQGWNESIDKLEDFLRKNS